MLLHKGTHFFVAVASRPLATEVAVTVR